MVDIRGVHDWKNLVSACRPRSADENIQMQFSLQLRARADGTIDVRSKSAVSASVPWNPWYQMMPHPQVSEADLPPSDKVPELAPNKPWPQFQDQIVPCLKKFYSRTFRHPVHIPPDERQEMLQFLRNGPAPPSAPAWIQWGDNNAGETPAAATDANHREAGPATTSGPPELPSKKVYRAFLAPHENADGKKCRCDSACE